VRFLGKCRYEWLQKWRLDVSQSTLALVAYDEKNPHAVNKQTKADADARRMEVANSFRELFLWAKKGYADRLLSCCCTRCMCCCSQTLATSYISYIYVRACVVSLLSNGVHSKHCHEKLKTKTTLERISVFVHMSHTNPI
jgi:hypothetical protein